MRTVPALLALSLLCAADETQDLVRRILSSRDAAERAASIDALVAAHPDPREVARRFAEGRAYPAEEETGWQEGTVEGGDGRRRPCLLHVPASYAPEKRYPFLVDLHGGVSRSPPLSHAELEQMKYFWGEHAEREGMFLAIPAGERGAEWWSAAGAAGVLRLVAETRRRYNVDENRVFVTGFSDGGSGSFYFALASPTPFAGVIPLNGHLGVAQAGGLQVHLRALLNVPIYAVNTTEDSLYPSAGVKPLVDAMKDLGVRITWREIGGYGHDPTYLPGERPAIAAWMAEQRRDPHPPTVHFEGAAPGRVRWLAVTALGTRKGAEFPDVNPPLPPGRPRIGVVIDQAFPGPGVLVSEVQPGSPAAAAGVEKGDILVAFDDREIGAFGDLAGALRAKAPGDAFRLRLRRGEATVEKEGTLPAPRAEPGLRRERPFGTLRAEAGENRVEVRAEGIASFEIYLSEPLFDLSKPVVVAVNGTTVHSGVVAPDLRFLAEQAAADEDRTMVYLARLRIAVGS